MIYLVQEMVKILVTDPKVTFLYVLFCSQTKKKKSLFTVTDNERNFTFENPKSEKLDRFMKENESLIKIDGN